MALWEDFKSTLRRWFLGQSAAEGGVKLKEAPAPEAETPTAQPAPRKPVVEPEIIMPRQSAPSNSTSSEIALEFATTMIKTLGQAFKMGTELANKESPKSLPAPSTDREPD